MSTIKTCAMLTSLDFESRSGNGFPIHVAYSGKHLDVGDAKIEEWLKTDNLWKIPARHRGAVFNYIQRKSIVMRNEQIHSLAARYDTGVIRHRYGGFENNAILLRQQKVVGGKFKQFRWRCSALT